MIFVIFGVLGVVIFYLFFLFCFLFLFFFLFLSRFSFSFFLFFFVVFFLYFHFCLRDNVPRCTSHPFTFLLVLNKCWRGQAGPKRIWRISEHDRRLARTLFDGHWSLEIVRIITVYPHLIYLATFSSSEISSQKQLFERISVKQCSFTKHDWCLHLELIIIYEQSPHIIILKVSWNLN